MIASDNLKKAIMLLELYMMFFFLDITSSHLLLQTLILLDFQLIL